ncbi:hypothetical protein C884_00334 [Kocuria palustris PEL]|uniref:Uncharacterized protein n=1 Tax=Kocuria palustris PEL TaxID=1236550 RepID=M2YDD1_9MICC|nr:hypothetical protein C884_00334 [Kocuria palustris PEL]
MQNYIDFAERPTTSDGDGQVMAEGAATNPFEGETPDFSYFGIEFQNAFVGLVAGLWGIVIILLGASLLWNLGKWGWARQRGMTDDLEDGMEGVKRSAIALICTALFGVIIGAILQVSGNLTA